MVKSKWKAFTEVFNNLMVHIKFRLKEFFLFTICFLIAIAFIKLFLLLNEHNYSEIISYGGQVTALIGALAALTFTYAATFEYPEKKAIREIGEHFLKSFLYFVIGLILSTGLYETVSKPNLSFFQSILPHSFQIIYFILSVIIMFILFWIGFVMLIVSAVYLGIGIYYLIINKYRSKAKYGEWERL